MRDIRKDLEERIEAIESRKVHFLFQIKRLDEKLTGLRQLLEQEEAEWKAKQPSLLDLGKDIAPIKTHTELSRFLINTLSDGKLHRTNEIAALAQSRNIPIKGKSYRRAVHFSLLGMKNNKLVDWIESGVWRIHKNRSGGD
jgi:chromosome segregation ATPase